VRPRIAASALVADIESSRTTSIVFHPENAPSGGKFPA
jgi:hypothetical protein